MGLVNFVSQGAGFRFLRFKTLSGTFRYELFVPILDIIRKAYSILLIEKLAQFM